MSRNTRKRPPIDIDWLGLSVPQVEAYERSGGAEANTLPGTDYPVIIVTSIGAKSGHVRKFPLMRVEHRGSYLLVGSKAGEPKHPAWYMNLKVHPESVHVQDGAERFAVDVRELEGEERTRWWERAVAAFPPYALYQDWTDRIIPVFLATRR